MPTYQYACTNPEGKHEFEVVQSFTDAPVAECPTCATPVRKVYGSVGVVFKGSGFYRTDSRSGSSSKESVKEPSKEPAKAAASADSSSSAKASSSTTASSSSSSSTGSAGSKAAAG